MPPIITIPNDTRLFAPAPKANAIGTDPSTTAKLVINIGRKRDVAASTTASYLFSLLHSLVGKFYYQDTVFGYQTYQCYDTYLAEYIKGLIEQP
jgi:hypothetical protein